MTEIIRGCIIGLVCVFWCVVVSQVWSQEGTQDRLRETKFLILTGPRCRKCGTPSRATWGSLLGVRSQKAGAKGKPKPESVRQGKGEGVG